MGLKYLVLGAGGQLGTAFRLLLQERGEDCLALGLKDLDITDPDSLRRALEEGRPDVVLNCAAYNQVDLAEREWREALRVNALAVGGLAQMARERGCILVHYSTDYVFDGAKGAPYTVVDLPNPLSRYGVSKLLGEDQVRQFGERWLLIRTSWVFGAAQGAGGANKTGGGNRSGGANRDATGSKSRSADKSGCENAAANKMGGGSENGAANKIVDNSGDGGADKSGGESGGGNFVTRLLGWARDRSELRVVTDQVSSPTYAGDLARATLLLLESGRHGLYHVSNSGWCSRYEWARFILEQTGWRGKLLPAASADFRSPAARPAFSALDNHPFTSLPGGGLPTWQEATSGYLNYLKETGVI